MKRIVAMAFALATIPLAEAMAADEPFDVNDISFLWPAPTNKADVDKLLTGDDLLANGKDKLWPGDIFKQLMATAQATTVAGTTRQIDFGGDKANFENSANWRVAGVRVDPSAPGCSDDIVKVRGSMPQVRLILQPVTFDGKRVVIHDTASHLVFNFGTVGADKRSIPDRAAFQAVIDDLKALKTKLNAAGVSTKGELDIHPGFKSKIADVFTDDLKKLLKTRLDLNRIGANAIMGLAPQPEPWVFISMAKFGDKFVAFPNASVGGQSAQMFQFGGKIVPIATPKNIEAGAKGVSTAILFSAAKLKDPVFGDGKRPFVEDVADIVANPSRTHFFNADCVSCHTETTRRSTRKIDVRDTDFKFAKQGRLAAAITPTSSWNLRNFGWFGSMASATHRTANEAIESVEMINRDYLAGK